MVKNGLFVVFIGIIILLIPGLSNNYTLTSLIIIGLGCAPIYPSMIHSTPSNFGKGNSQAIIGIEMASAYIGTTFMPPLFGLIAQKTTVNIFPYYLLIFLILIFIMQKSLQKKIS